MKYIENMIIVKCVETMNIVPLINKLYKYDLITLILELENWEK